MIDRRRFLGWTAAAGLAGLPLARSAFALEAGRPSLTAFGAARHRAVHQLLDQPRVFDDPLALRILGAGSEDALRANAERFQTGGSRAMRAFIAMRSRYAEDRLAEAHARGVRQYVVLGAGLDTFACRNPHPGLQVFEVDFPATQEWKRDQLRRSGIALPESLTFAPVDFEKQTLADGLKAAGLLDREPVFFSMLGVVIYLTREATFGTLRFAASLPPGSEMVFDFALPDEAVSEPERASRAVANARLAKIGEPWISYFDAAALSGEMRALGYASTEALGTSEGNERYFAQRADGLRLHGSGRMMAGRV